MSKYLRFYSMGYCMHGRKTLKSRADVDIDELANDLAPDNVGEVGKIFDGVRELAKREASKLDGSRERKTWIEAHQEEITEAGIDGKDAYAAFCAGQIDAMTVDVLNDLNETFEGDEGDDDDDDGDDDDDDE